MTHVYVVSRGRRPGIYHTWKECNDQVVSFKRATFKKLKSLEEAKVALDLYFCSQSLAGNDVIGIDNAQNNSSALSHQEEMPQWNTHWIGPSNNQGLVWFLLIVILVLSLKIMFH